MAVNIYLLLKNNVFTQPACIQRVDCMQNGVFSNITDKARLASAVILRQL